MADNPIDRLKKALNVTEHEINTTKAFITDEGNINTRKMAAGFRETISADDATNAIAHFTEIRHRLTQVGDIAEEVTTTVRVIGTLAALGLCYVYQDEMDRQSSAGSN